MPEGSHLMAFTSFCRTQTWFSRPPNPADESAAKTATYRVSLEGLEGPVAAEATHVDAHICAAGGKGGVVLPVHVQGWSCGKRSLVTRPTTQKTTAVAHPAAVGFT